MNLRRDIWQLYTKVREYDVDHQRAIILVADHFYFKTGSSVPKSEFQANVKYYITHMLQERSKKT